jgi:hypothetical protein
MRFFLVVTPPAVWMRVAFVIAAAAGVLTLWFDPREVDAGFGSILLLQMFAVSNGFAASAGRGHFDPLLVSGRSRTRIALENCLASSLPGVFAWMVIALAAVLLGHSRSAVSPHRVLALVMVSCAAWSGGLALPRLASGALWSLALVALAMSRGLLSDFALAVQSPPAGFRQVVASASAIAACPFLLLGEFPGAKDPRVLAIDAAAAVGMLLAGARYIRRREYELGEDA